MNNRASSTPLFINNTKFDLPDGHYEGVITDANLSKNGNRAELTIQVNNEEKSYAFVTSVFLSQTTGREQPLDKLLSELHEHLNQDIFINDLVGYEISFKIYHTENDEYRYCNIRNIEFIYEDKEEDDDDWDDDDLATQFDDDDDEE